MHDRRQFLTGLAAGGLVPLRLAHGAGDAELRVVFAEGLEPLCWEENGQARGEQPEIAQALLTRLGIAARFIFLPWPRAQKLVESGGADLMMTTPTAARFKYAAFGREMTTPNYWNLFVASDQPELIERARSVTRLADLLPYQIVDFIGNGWADVYLPAEAGFRVQRVQRLSAIPQMLKLHRADLAINSSTAMNWFMRKQGLTSALTELDLIAPGTRFHMVFQLSRRSPWAQTDLLKRLDTELRAMRESGRWLAVLKKYQNPFATGRPFQSLLQVDEFYR